jgi:hypothetical protein
MHSLQGREQLLMSFCTLFVLGWVVVEQTGVQWVFCVSLGPDLLSMFYHYQTWLSVARANSACYIQQCGAYYSC